MSRIARITEAAADDATRVTYQDDRAALILGDCRAFLSMLESDSVDSIVTDPPYHLTSNKRGGSGDASTNLNSPYGRARVGTGAARGFMGKEWDGGQIAHDPALWAEALRVLKPGGYLVAFGGSRTYHRLAVAVEDAGFEIRDSLMWLYGSGFPKSHNVSKAIDKAAGAEREVVGVKRTADGRSRGLEPAGSKHPGGDYHGDSRPWKDDPEAVARYYAETAPATDEAKTWDGWGTALKPAHEPIVLARKPFQGTVVDNVLEHGTAALNIDGCRIEASPDDPNVRDRSKHIYDDTAGYAGGFGTARATAAPYQLGGRWPANVILTHHPDCLELGTKEVKGDNRTNQDGRREGGFVDTGAAKGDGKPNGPLYGDAVVEAWECHPDCPVAILDGQSGHLVSGRNSVKRASAAEAKGNQGAAYGAESRPAGTPMIEYHDAGGASRFFYHAKASKKERNQGMPDGEKNDHPTVKPVALIAYLMRLVTQPGGIVVDPFVGSGTAGMAARREGFLFLGGDMDEHYLNIAEHRIRSTNPGLGI